MPGLRVVAEEPANEVRRAGGRNLDGCATESERAKVDGFPDILPRAHAVTEDHFLDLVDLPHDQVEDQLHVRRELRNGHVIVGSVPIGPGAGRASARLLPIRGRARRVHLPCGPGERGLPHHLEQVSAPQPPLLLRRSVRLRSPIQHVDGALHVLHGPSQPRLVRIVALPAKRHPCAVRFPRLCLVARQDGLEHRALVQVRLDFDGLDVLV